jgi:hypothetical protein
VAKPVDSLTQAGSSPATYTVSHNAAGDRTTLPAPNSGEQSWSYGGNGNQTASYGITGIVTNTYNDLEQLTNMVGPGTTAECSGRAMTRS